jgi:hypothetical protein
MKITINSEIKRVRVYITDSEGNRVLPKKTVRCRITTEDNKTTYKLLPCIFVQKEDICIEWEHGSPTTPKVRPIRPFNRKSIDKIRKKFKDSNGKLLSTKEAIELLEQSKGFVSKIKSYIK